MQSVLFAAMIHWAQGKKKLLTLLEDISRKRLKSLSSKKQKQKNQRPSSLNSIDFWRRFKRLFTYFPSFLSVL